MTKLKIGDKVVMNDKYYDKRKGEVFTIKAGPQRIGRTECFWLEGYDGAYCADGLSLYQPPTNEEYYTKSTEELAKLLANVCNNLLQKVYEDGGYVPHEYDEEDSGYWLNWLKEKYDEQ